MPRQSGVQTCMPCWTISLPRWRYTLAGVPERRHEQEDRGVGFGRRVQRGIEAMLIGRGNCQRLHVFHTNPSSL
jgi:hypothetical protein